MELCCCVGSLVPTHQWSLRGCRTTILKEEGEPPKIIIHIGTNVIGRKRNEVQRSEYREMGEVKKQDLEGGYLWITLSATCL